MITPWKHSYIPLTDPTAQMDAVFHFCTVWCEPLILDYQGQKMILMPFAYYLEASLLLGRSGGDAKAAGRV